MLYEVITRGKAFGKLRSRAPIGGKGIVGIDGDRRRSLRSLRRSLRGDKSRRADHKKEKKEGENFGFHRSLRRNYPETGWPALRGRRVRV